MTRLSSRDRAKVNAALVLIRDAGHDVGEVTRLASIGLKSGTPPRMAYERAFNRFVERVPSLQAPLQRLGQLIEATDHQTLARYNVALSKFIETGDRIHLDTIMPTVQQDMRSMAQMTGDAGFADGLEDTAPVPAQAPQPAEALGTSPEPSQPGRGPMGHSAAKASSGGAASFQGPLRVESG